METRENRGKTWKCWKRRNVEKGEKIEGRKGRRWMEGGTRRNLVVEKSKIGHVVHGRAHEFFKGKKEVKGEKRKT